MSPFPEALAAHLEGEATTLCHCWRLTRTDGEMVGFTDHDRTLTVDGTTFAPQSGFSASEARDTLGLAVDTVDVEGALSSDGLDEAEIAAGRYDNATVETLLVNWRDPGQFTTLRVSTVGKMTRRDALFVAELKSAAHRLDQTRGRLVTRGCDAELGDVRCGVSLAGAGLSGSGVVLLSASSQMTVSGLEGFAAGWLANGLLHWTSGAREGISDRIVAHRVGAEGVMLSMQPASGAAAVAGDAFTIVAGCDKRFATCTTKFANAVNFRGFPHLPGNDAAYGYVADGGIFDGGPLVP